MLDEVEVDEDPAAVDEDDGSVLVEVVLLEEDEAGAVEAVESGVLGTGVA